MLVHNSGYSQEQQNLHKTEEERKNVPEYCQVLKFKDSNGQVKEMIFPKALDLDRPKRPRTTFSESQLSILEQEFQKSPYLIGKDRTRLAQTLGLTETQIKVWFQNRRTKSKREKTDDDEPSTKIARPTEVQKQKSTPSPPMDPPSQISTLSPPGFTAFYPGNAEKNMGIFNPLQPGFSVVGPNAIFPQNPGLLYPYQRFLGNWTLDTKNA